MADKKQNTRDYEMMGRTLESIFSYDYVSRRKLYWINFSRGLFFGLGATIGGTLVVALLIWILSFFTELPLIGGLVDTINNTIGN